MKGAGDGETMKSRSMYLLRFRRFFQGNRDTNASVIWTEQQRSDCGDIKTIKKNKGRGERKHMYIVLKSEVEGRKCACCCKEQMYSV